MTKTLTAFTFDLTKDGHAAEFTFYAETLAAARKIAEQWSAKHGWSLVEDGHQPSSRRGRGLVAR